MTPEQAQESAWIQQVLAGRTEAFQALVERYFGTVRLVAMAKTGNAADAEDVAQETFIKAYETLGVLRNRGRVAPWLVSIARNLAITLVRRRERERRAARAMPLDPRVYPDHEKRETLDAVARQVEALPENLREVVLLHYFEGLKCREIADRLDMSTAAVLKRLSRGRDLLGDRLLREWGESRAGATPSRVIQVMGAIAVLPRPDWGAQLAGMGAVGALKGGGWAAAILGPPLALKVGTMASAVVLAALYFALNPREDSGAVRGTQTARTRPEVTTELPRDDLQTVRAVADVAAPLPDVPVSPALVPAGFVAGTVVDLDGVPIGGANITVGGNGVGGKTSSASNGTFRVELAAQPGAARPTGRLTPVKAPANGERPADLLLDLNLECLKEGYSPVVQSGVRPGDTGIEVVMARPALITGRVVDASNGRPVREFSLFRGNFPMQAFDSKDGSFALEGAFGIDFLTVVAPGYASADLDLQLLQGYGEEGRVVELQPGAEVHGIVVDAKTRKPIKDAYVEVQYDRQPAGTGERVQTDKSGAFMFGDLPPDTGVSILANAANYAPTCLDATAAYRGEKVTIRLGQGGGLRGRLLYNGKPPEQVDTTKTVMPSRDELESGQPFPAQPSNEATIYLEYLEFGKIIMTRIGSGADFEFPRLAEGPYLVRAERGTLQMYAFTEIVPGQVTKLDLDFATNSGYAAASVSGVRDPAAVQFEMCPAENPARIVSAKGESFFSRLRGHLIGYPGVAPGDYLIRAYLPGSGEVASERRVDVREGQVTTVNFNLDDVGN